MLEDLFGNKLNTDEAIATAEELRRILLKKHKGLSNSNFDFTKLKDLEVKDIIEGLRTISSEYTIAARNFVNSGAYDIEKAKKAL
jgi:hypothetical protein